MAGVYDLSNRTFTEGWYRNFTVEFENMGGNIILTTTFTSGRDVSYLRIANDLIRAEAQGVVIVAGALDTAMIC
jgi:branched-chain amino acid transport system substrate-binding protein